MKRFAVVLSGLDDDPEIKFFEAEDWREAALKAAQRYSEDYPLWNCLDVPDDALEDDEAEPEETPIMVPVDLSDALRDASGADMYFAIAEVPPEIPA